MASAGRILLIPKGTWTSGTSYNALDFVYYGGNSYVCKSAVSGSTDPMNDTTHWQRMASGFDSNLITQTITNDANKIPSDAAVYAEVRALEADFATIEESTTASQTYAVGDYFIYGGKLYVATAAISSGGTITPGTNCSETSLAAQIKSINDRRVRNIVILGDSWNDVDQEYGSTKWPALLANTNPEMQIHNYSKGGACIVGADNYALNGNVGGQIAAAIADTSYNHDYIDTIIILAGINDFRSASSVTNQAAYNIADDIKAKIENRLKPEFPNAEYVFIFNNSIPASHAQYMFSRMVCKYVSLITSCRAYSTIGWINPSYYREDYIHPNENGHKSLLSNIRAILFGGNIVYTWANIVNIPVTDGSETAQISLIQSVTENAIITQLTWNSTTGPIPNATTMTGNLTSNQLHNLVYFPAWFGTCDLVNNGANFGKSTIRTEYITTPSAGGTRNAVTDGKITLYTEPITGGVGLGFLISNNNW